MAKMALKVKVNDLHFQYQPRVSQDTCLEQIWWFQLKTCDELSCEQGKVYGRTDRQTDGQTDAGNDNSPSAWKAKG